ncbi:hypothetical protein Cantr_06696 [Candida viswanathii]|uniref:CCZ1/INTU/HSP4 first Longin domain-containing protein n=1 Tax=Candida viswanathii TaxID=5486 RepID=A0A367XV37_9ASCO|nr:hypothetical protein Cantr_06696 [Candida viswanathii]
MSSYFTQYIPGINLINNGQSATPSIQESHHTQTQESPLFIKYLTIFNPTFVSPREESNDELYKQIITFLHAQDTPEISQLDQLKLVGLMRGVYSLGDNFNSSENNPTVVKASNASTIMLELEKEYFMICCVENVGVGEIVDVVNEQLVKLVRQMHEYFQLFNKSITEVYQLGETQALKKALDVFWGNFVTSYNLQELKLPKLSHTWLNTMNYQGFLGLSRFTKYKKSSITVNTQTHDDIESLISDNGNISGVLVNYFNRKFPKRHGLIYSNPRGVESDGLINIYNWLEYNEYHGTLENLKKDDVENHIRSNLPGGGGLVEDSGYGFDISLGLKVLNPVNLTNTLVISPLNYTVSTVMEGANSSRYWMSMPQLFKNMTLGNGEQVQEEAAAANEGEEEEDEEEEEEDLGEFIIGLQPDGTILKQTVHLKSNDGAYKEYQLVVLRKDDFYVTLVINAQDTQIDVPTYYTTLQTDILIPITEQLETVMLNGSVLQSSINSLKTLYLPNDIDQEFFYIIYDPKQQSFQSSLPYLPYVGELGEDSLVKYQIMAIYYLHDQLSKIFNSGFFGNGLNEFFHKFTSNKLNDWMFYYFRYRDKYIIVIKNKSKHTTGNNGLNGIPPVVEKSILNKISEGVLDYATLGFLENLGDDVKYWLGTQQEPNQ